MDAGEGEWAFNPHHMSQPFVVLTHADLCD